MSVHTVYVKIEAEESEFVNENGHGIVAVLRLAHEQEGVAILGHGGWRGNGCRSGCDRDRLLLRALLSPTLEQLRQMGVRARDGRGPVVGLVFKLEAAAEVAVAIERGARPVVLNGQRCVAAVRAIDRIPLRTMQSLVGIIDMEKKMRLYHRTQQHQQQRLLCDTEDDQQQQRQRTDASDKDNDEKPEPTVGTSTEKDEKDIKYPVVGCFPGPREVAHRYDRFVQAHSQFATKLLPFQHAGVQFGLARGGRVLIADEMGVGKTFQAIALSLCYYDEWPLLIVVPASLRLQWAEELEKTVQGLRPEDISVILTSSDRMGTTTVRDDDDVNDNVAIAGGSAGATRMRTGLPLVTITSYTMLVHLEDEFRAARYKVVILDESHKLRGQSSRQTAIAQHVTDTAKRIIMLSGTPCVSKPFDVYQQVDILRPGMLGESPRDFGRRYCNRHETSAATSSASAHSSSFRNCDFSGGRRQNELRLLLNKAVMIRRLKAEVGANLPPLRRQIVQLDVGDAHKVKTVSNGGTADWKMRLAQLKTHTVVDWLGEQIASNPNVKFLVFGHHTCMMDAVQGRVLEKHGIGYIRIDGTTPANERSELVRQYTEKTALQVALLSITAAGVGLDFSAANVMVFTELPVDVAALRQAEDRTHRRGQCRPVNSYYLCARKSAEEFEWQRLSNSLDVIMAVQESRRIVDADGGSLDADAILTATDGLGHNVELNSSENGEDHAAFGCEASATAQLASTHEARIDAASAVDFDARPCTNDVDCEHHYLWIEVSRHTGRLHLHGNDNGRSPLGVNFAPQDIIADTDSSSNNKNNDGGGGGGDAAAPAKPLPSVLARDPLSLRLVRDFLIEWNALSAQTRSMLYGKLLRPPLRDAIDEARIAKLRAGTSCDLVTSYSTERHAGFVSSPSKRRLSMTASLHMHAGGGAVGCGREAAATHAVWHRVSYRVFHSDEPQETLQAFSATGRRLCIFCKSPYSLRDPSGGEVPCTTTLRARYQLYCRGECQQQHMLRTSSRSLRYAIARLERGVCHGCGTDCISLVRRLRGIMPPVGAGPDDSKTLQLRLRVVRNLAPQFCERGNESRLFRLLRFPCEAHAWEADHTTPVYAGGGRCGLENLHCLCCCCHAKKSAAEAAERAHIKRRKKQHRSTGSGSLN